MTSVAMSYHISQIDRLKRRYDDIQWGYHWSDRLTENAVGRLEKLKYKKIMDEILDDKRLCFEEKWELGIKFTRMFGEIVTEVDQFGWKLVNGSLGEWCPDAGDHIIRFWESMIDISNKSIKKEVNNLIVELIMLFGDYACDVGYILKQCLHAKTKNVTKKN